jgi:hypothetical protein
MNAQLNDTSRTWSVSQGYAPVQNSAIRKAAASVGNHFLVLELRVIHGRHAVRVLEVFLTAKE